MKKKSSIVSSLRRATSPDKEFLERYSIPSLKPFNYFKKNKTDLNEKVKHSFHFMPKYSVDSVTNKIRNVFKNVRISDY